MQDWLKLFSVLWQQLRAFGVLAGSTATAVWSWYSSGAYRSLPGAIQHWLLQTTLRQRLIALAVFAGWLLLQLILRRVAQRSYRDPVLAHGALLRETALLMTQLRGRAYRPARMTQRALVQRLKRSRRAFDAAQWDRLWAQWKQADREVQTLLDTLRRQPSHVVRAEHFKHLATLRDTLHAEVNRAR